ncbi:MAG: hypothetical protein HFF59_04995 [Lawsonibacter sp.]|jgi:hypothetical protein|uniref:hypothetical protein n=1 Tax=Lawsonibacter sp. JLR.KK007 TaxID=3114293 RepID=UPI00216D9DEB|nr:hypothetical protein [Lawsonibacter sp.]
MQDLLAEVIWDNEDIHIAAKQLCKSFPGYSEAQQQCLEAIETLKSALGFELCDRLCTQIARHTRYELRAYYTIGLGLRQDIAQALER